MLISFGVLLISKNYPAHVTSPDIPKQAAFTEVCGDLSDLPNLKDLRLIFLGDGKLLLNLQDLLRCMFMKKTLHVRCEFAQKISGRIRAQGTAKAVHRIPQAPIMSRVVAILQRAAEQRA